MRTDTTVAGRKFIVGYTYQTEWKWLIAFAFFFGKVGASLFLLSLFFDFSLGALLGLLVVAIGKGGAHLLYLGRPLRAWRGVMNPRAWLARGFWAMLAFLIFGVTYWLLLYFGAQPGGGLWIALKVVAGASAFMLMIYEGFLMSASPSIQLWSNALLPMLFLFFSFLVGTTTTSLLLHWAEVPVAEWLPYIDLAFVALNLLLVLGYIGVTVSSTSAARFSMRTLIRGKYAVPFNIGAIGVGLVLLLALAITFLLSQNLIVLTGAAAADLVGHFIIFYLLLRAGVFAPPVGA